jgi:quinol monooxygenase YgiN
MLVITGTVRIPEGKVNELVPIMTDVIENSRKEKGCLLYAFSLDVLEPTLLRISERWETQEDLAAHAQSEHVKRWRKEGVELGVHDRQLKLHEVSSVKDL